MLTFKKAAIAASKELIRLAVILILLLLNNLILMEYVETRTPEIMGEQFQKAGNALRQAIYGRY
jgi:hypothetical protein